MEVLEALLDELNVKDARHAFLSLAERLEFGLQSGYVKLNELLGGRCVKVVVTVLMGLLFS